MRRPPDRVDALPPLARHLLLPLIGEAPAHEPRSTCAGCPACGPGAPVAFLPDLKCCAFEPQLAAQLVGGVLAEGRPEALGPLRARLAEPGLATPLGLRRSPRYVAEHERLDGRARFGREPALACPHLLDGGRCGIHDHREATCATWFCRVERGATGLAAWQALRALLREVEEVVARWCAAELGAGPGGFGPWTGDLEGYYLACHRLAWTLDGPRLRALGGFALRLRLRGYREARAALQAPLPEGPLQRAAGLKEEPLPDGGLRAFGLSVYDPLDLPPEVARALDAGGEGLDAAWRRALLDWGVLRAPAAAPGR